MSWKPNVCIYHAHCTDGFGAAWAVYRKWGDDVAYVPMSYNDPLPDIAGKHVLMVDFSLKQPAMIEAAKLAKSIVVLDHHDTAEQELSLFVPVDKALRGAAFTPELMASWVEATPEAHLRVWAQFDMAKSGARLAWEFCHPDKPIPRLLELIEDRDLWRFAFGMDTKAVRAALSGYELTFERFDAWVAGSDLALEALIAEGMPVARVLDKHVADFVSHTYWAEVAGHKVPILNVPYAFASECGHELLKRYPDAPFAATWFRSGHGKILWSLRSEKSREDVGKIAAARGGGGHRNASGFSVDAVMMGAV